jgi:hypothetical protein
MKLKLENLDVASFPTTGVAAAAPALAHTGEDCWSFRVCVPTNAHAE